MFQKSSRIAAVLIFVSFSVLTAQTIRISGVVRNAVTNQALPGVVVKLPSYDSVPGRLKHLGLDTLRAVTDARGVFTFTNSTPVLQEAFRSAVFQNTPLVSGNRLLLCLQTPEQVSLRMMSLCGKVLYSFKGQLQPGAQAIPLPDKGSGVLLYQLKIGNRDHTLACVKAGSGGTRLMHRNTVIAGLGQVSARAVAAEAARGTLYAAHPDYLATTSFIDNLIVSNVEIKLLPTSIPAVFPGPDSRPPVTTTPLKVFILLGQSNMIGYGQIDPDTLHGTLSYYVRKQNKYPWTVDSTGKWAVRNDVWATNLLAGVRNGRLTVGFGNGTTRIGVEYQFGQVMGYYYDEEVLVIKSSMGNRSLSWDILPPGSQRFDYNGRTYAGYGDSTPSWPIGASQHVIDSLKVNWYAGLQYDAFVKSVHTVLDNIPKYFTDYQNQGYEVTGFVWWQGDKDAGGEPQASRYEFNLVNLIKALRQEFNAPNAKFVAGTYVKNGWNLTNTALEVVNGQLAVSGERGKYPDFAGNVMTVEGRDYYRDQSISPKNQDYHENWNAETYMLLGDAMGKAMACLLRK